MNINRAGLTARILSNVAAITVTFTAGSIISPAVVRAASTQNIRIDASENAKINAAIGVSRTQILALRQDAKMPIAKKQLRGNAIMAAQKAKILSILRPNQKAALLKIEELNKEIQKSITPAESKQMQAVERSAQEQMMQIINDKSVPNSAKNGKLMQVRIQGQMAIVTLLNPSQKAKYNEIHSLQQQMQYLPGK